MSVSRTVVAAYHGCNRSLVQVVIMYLTKGIGQELQMQLCHSWPLDVQKVINGTWKYEQEQAA